MWVVNKDPVFPRPEELEGGFLQLEGRPGVKELAEESENRYDNR